MFLVNLIFIWFVWLGEWDVFGNFVFVLENDFFVVYLGLGLVNWLGIVFKRRLDLYVKWILGFF